LKATLVKRLKTAKIIYEYKIVMYRAVVPNWGTLTPIAKNMGYNVNTFYLRVQTRALRPKFLEVCSKMLTWPLKGWKPLE